MNIDQFGEINDGANPRAKSQDEHEFFWKP